MASQRAYQHPALHRLAGDVERPDVRLVQRFFAIVGAEPGNERALPYADEYVAVQEEAAAAEHLLLFDALLAVQGVPDANGEEFIEGHYHSLQCACRWWMSG